MKYRISKKYIIAIAIVVLIAIITINLSRAVLLSNDSEVEPNSNLTYYINVYYDGVDIDGVESNDATISSLSSGYILVTDKIPQGLTFKEFVNSNNGTIGAVLRSDESKSCPGEVIGGIKGINYDAATQIVSFKVRNLQAGCKLTVGIVTQTPQITNNRVDFYNYSIAKENNLASSNRLHSYSGFNNITMHKVSYEITGDKPLDIVGIPEAESYTTNSIVGVQLEPQAAGYTFSGWSSNDASISNNVFTMPDHDVVLTGYFTPSEAYNVSYEIVGTTPLNFELPEDSTYYKNDTVRIDSLRSGDTIGNYVFNGWSSSNVTIENNNYFLMPENDVKLVGTFSEKTYKVCYKFDSIIGQSPPECESYKKGEEVNLIDMQEYLNKDSKYLFLGYDKETKFIMGENDITVTAKFQEINGYFTPQIELISTNDKEYYDIGETDTLNLKITNNENYDIKDLLISINEEINNNNLTYQICDINNNCDDTTLEYITDNIYKLELLPAKSILKAKENINIKIDKSKSIEVTILSAIADNDYYFKQEIKQTHNYYLKNTLKICNNSNGRDNILNYTFQYHITSLDKVFDTWLIINANTCSNIYLPNNEYKVEQLNTTLFTSNNRVQQVIINDNDNTLTFNNKYTRSRFFSSYGKRINRIGGQP